MVTSGTERGNRLVTSIDVAKLAGVSQSTVSRAFSEQAKLSDATKQRVLDAAHQLGYRPNAIARSLVSNRTNIIGLIIMQNSSPFYNILIDMMVSGCRDYGYCAMVIRQQEGESGSETVARALDYRVDGLAITAIENSENASEICRQARVPIVLLNRVLSGVEVDTVCCNNHGAAQSIIRFLAKCGHKNLACLMGDSKASTTQERLNGMEAEIPRSKMKITNILYGSYTYQSGQAMCRQLMAEKKIMPDVIFCSGDVIAFGVMDTLRYEFGLKVPENISVIGFDDTMQAGWDSYQLTTMRQPYGDLVDSACQLLVNRIEGSGDGKTHMIHGCQLVERKSVGKR